MGGGLKCRLGISMFPSMERLLEKILQFLESQMPPRHFDVSILGGLSVNASGARLSQMPPRHFDVSIQHLLGDTAINSKVSQMPPRHFDVSISDCVYFISPDAEESQMPPRHFDVSIFQLWNARTWFKSKSQMPPRHFDVSIQQILCLLEIRGAVSNAASAFRCFHLSSYCTFKMDKKQTAFDLECR